MIFSKSFLLEALPYATFSVSGVTLEHDTVWDFIGIDHKGTVSIDSRSIEPGQLFVALHGAQSDGHKHLGDALKKGALVLLIQESKKEFLSQIPAQDLAKKLVIIVPDTRTGLIDLAICVRKNLTCPVVGITGSVGKTSTKEMVRTILSQTQLKYAVSFKNYNSIYGVCLNLLSIDLDVQAVVCEVGINGKGEMQEIANVLRPTIGLINCIVHAHALGLGSLEDISYEKRQLFSNFSSTDVGIIFGDQAVLTDIYYAHPIAKFGFKTKNQVQARKVHIKDLGDNKFTTNFILKWYGEKSPIALQGNHGSLVHNALAASAIAYFLNISLHNVVAGLEKFQGFENRFEAKKIKGTQSILYSDCYNANPESMKAALAAFEQMTAKGTKIAVLGDMLELGPKEAYWHRQIGRFLYKTLSIELLILVGERSKSIAKTAPVMMKTLFVKDWQGAKVTLEQVLTEEALVLVKSSRGMNLLSMVKEITE